MKHCLVALALLAAMATLNALDVEKDIVERSRTYVGSPYRTGGVEPPAFDCSGFVGFIVRPFIPALPRLSRDMADFGTPIKKEDLRAGDLVFFATTEIAGAISHVAIYLGDGKIIHAISDGPERGVRVTALDARYWKKHYHSAARVLPETKGQTTPRKQTAPKERATAATEEDKPPAKESATRKETPPVAPSQEPAPSPWDSWDGYVAGDYAQWKAREDAAFDKHKDAYDADAERSKFEEWKRREGKK